MTNYDEELDKLIDASFTQGVKSEQLRMAGELNKILAVQDSVKNADWQEGYVIALQLISKVIQQENVEGDK